MRTHTCVGATSKPTMTKKRVRINWNKYFRFSSRSNVTLTHPPSIPCQGTVAAWSLLPRSHRSSLPLVHSAAWHCIAWMLVLARYTLYREWLSRPLGNWSTFLVFLSRTKEEVLWTRSWSIQGAGSLQDAYWLNNSSIPSFSSSQLRIWASDPLHSCCTTHHHRMQILSLKPRWSHCLNESHRKGNPFSFALTPSVRFSAIHPWLQTWRSLFIASSESRAYSRQE